MTRAHPWPRVKRRAIHELQRTSDAAWARWNRALIGVLRLAFRRRPVPLRIIRATRRLTRGLDPLAPPTRPEVGYVGKDPRLIGLLAGRELGVWTLGSASIGLLQDTIADRRPRSILEFGSGISTIAIASSIAAIQAPERPVVVSLDQDPDEAGRTRVSLESAGLNDLVDVKVAPLVQRSLAGRVMSVYGIDPEVIASAGPFDLVLIDGPMAEPGARYATLALHGASLAPEATVLLDDALRDGEIWAATRWAELPGVSVQGVLLVDKGVLIATVDGRTFGAPA